MNKNVQRLLIGISLLFILLSIALLLNLLDQPASRIAELILPYSANATWPYRFRQIGAVILAVSSISLLVILNQSNRGRFISYVKVKALALFSWLDQKVKGLPDVEAKLPKCESWPVFKFQDWMIVSFFLVYVVLVFLGSLQGNFPNPLLGGDSGNTASFAAGLDHPDLFHTDMLLSSPDNVRIYSTFNVLFMRLLYPSLKSYTLSLSILIPVQVFSQLVGFYLFGLILFGKRFWGVALSALLAMSVGMNLGEYWSIPVDPIARSNFQAFLPFILCMVLVWRNKPVRWPWIMAATGLLIYLHPVSTPCWAATIWLSLLLFVPRRWSVFKRLGFMFGVGLIFIIVSLPYVITYFSFHVQGRSTNYDLVYNTIVNYFPENLLNTPAALISFLGIMLQNGILPLAVASLIVVLVLRRSNREPLYLILAWMSGILLMTIIVPFAIHTYEHIFRLIPAETEMVRALRYLIPFMLLLGLWMVYEISMRVRFYSIPKPVFTTGLVIVLTGCVVLTSPFRLIQSALSCLSQGQLICMHLSDYDLLIQAVEKKVPEGAPVFATFADNSYLSYGLPIRYIALRPLIYSFKDRGLLVYSNDAVLHQWNDIYQQALKIDRITGDEARKLDDYLLLAKQLGAQYLVTDIPFDRSTPFTHKPKEIYRNNGFALVEVDLK